LQPVLLLMLSERSIGLTRVLAASSTVRSGLSRTRRCCELIKNHLRPADRLIRLAHPIVEIGEIEFPPLKRGESLPVCQ
jgi:hypothetical protein